jgi:hypothetical protein
MRYELWDVQTGNRVEGFASEREALEAVRELLILNGPRYLEILALGAVPSEGEAGRIALPPILEGHALLTRVLRMDAPPSEARQGEHVPG